MVSRRSRRAYGDGSLDLAPTASLLQAACRAGSIPRTAAGPRDRRLPAARCIPSISPAGASTGWSKPCTTTTRCDTGSSYCVLGPAEDGGALTPYPELLADSAAFVVLTAMLWRSRLSTAPARTVSRCWRRATSRRLAAAEALQTRGNTGRRLRDRLTDSFVGVDGLYETTLYILPVGTRAA